MEIFIVFFLLLIGFLIAFLSAVLVGINQDFLNLQIESGSIKAEKLYTLKVNFDESVSGFFLIELLFYVSGAVIGVQYLNDVGMEWKETALLSVSSFFLSAIFRTVYYSIGIRLSERIALPLTTLFSIISPLLKPINFLNNYLIENISGRSVSEAGREEINALIESSHEDGAIDTDEYRILKNIMHFSDVLVSDVMTPRTVVFSCEADKTVDEIVNLPEIKMYSRFPIWEGDSLDEGVMGYVLSKDILHAALKGKRTLPVKELAKEVYFIPENVELDNALESFLKRRQHLFVVVDEYGGFEGLLTMEDVLETMLGVEIVDEADRVVDLREFAKQRRDLRIANILSNSEN